MIHESKYWKDELLVVSRKLKTWKKLKNFSRLEGKLFRIEKNIFIGAYAVRKLLDSYKVASNLSNMPLNIVRYSPNGKEVTFMNKDDIDDLYDPDNGSLDQLPLREFCNQIVHSYVFIIDLDDEGITGIFVSSDRERNSKLLYIPVDEIVKTFEVIGNDYPSEMRMTYNPKRKDYDIQLDSN